MMKDLRNTVVREHGQGGHTSAGTVWKEGMWGRGVCGEERGPCFSDENLGTLPEENCATAMRKMMIKGCCGYVPRCPPRDRSSLKDGKVSTTVWTSSNAVPRPRRDLWKASKKPAYDPPKSWVSVKRRSTTDPTDDVHHRGWSQLAS